MLIRPSLYAFLLLISLTARADEPCPVTIADIREEEVLVKIQDQAIKGLPQLAGDEESLKMAACASKKLPNVSLDKLDAEDPRIVSAFQQFTTHTGYCSSSGDCKPQLSPEAQACPNTKCKLFTQFGKKEAELMVFALEKFHLNASSLSFSPGYTAEKFQNWRAEELQDVLLAAMDMPPQMTNDLSNQQLSFRNTMRDELFSGTLADSRTSFNELWAGQNSAERRTTSFHEFGHVFSHHFNVSESEAWRKMTGWEYRTVGNEKRWVARKPTAIVSQYGGSDPEEDFAESVTAYRYNPKLLKAASPDKYRFVKEIVFGGREFTKKSKCEAMPVLEAGWQDTVKVKLSSWK